MFDYDALQELGIESVKITYSGSGDEGYIDEIETTPETEAVQYRNDHYEEIENEAYSILENKWPGWEINEGSHGAITVNVKERKAVLHHGHNIMTTEWQDSEV